MSLVRVSAGAIGALALAAVLVACDAGARRGIGRGTVVSVDRVNRVIVIDHGRIPGVMAAMKMSFQVAEPKLLDQVEPGQLVEFDVEPAMGSYRVTAIRTPQP